MVFDFFMADGSPPNEKVHCPTCCGVDIIEAPPWAPLDSGTNIFDGNEWQYECQDCKSKFKMPIPQSPSEDKNRKCPVCNSGHLHLLTGAKAIPLYCG
jgi:DNA-directed RNA polymerase subunit RPC12/RpoP